MLFGAPKSQHGPWMLAVGLALLIVTHLNWHDGHGPPWVHFAQVAGVILTIEGFRALRNNGSGAA